MQIEETHCCGVSIMSWITSQVRNKKGAEEALAEVIKHSFCGDRSLERCINPKAQYVFVDVKMKTVLGLDCYSNYDGTSGRILAEYITNNGLGTVISSRWNTNPVHTDRELKTYTWTPSPERFKEWALSNRTVKAAYKKHVKEHKARYKGW